MKSTGMLSSKQLLLIQNYCICIATLQKRVTYIYIYVNIKNQETKKTNKPKKNKNTKQTKKPNTPKKNNVFQTSLEIIGFFGLFGFLVCIYVYVYKHLWCFYFKHI